jgi:Flp pilus assembly protein TadG
MNITRRHRSITDETGQTATELALVLPVFCLLLFAVIQFGILFKNYVTLTDAVRAGARTAAVSRLDAKREEVVKAAVRRSASGLEPCNAADKTGLCISVSATKWEHAGEVTVEASYPYEINLLGFVAAKGHLTSKTTERVE